MTLYEEIALGVSAVALVVSVLSAWYTHRRWKLDTGRVREMSRKDFLSKLSAQFMTHNWKFLEHWDNPGVRPGLTSTGGINQQEAFGKRVVHLDHLNFLWQVYAHKELLNRDDIDGFRSWARSWYTDAFDSLKIIFETGDLYPLDFVEWLQSEIFESGFGQLIGSGLDDRLQKRKAGAVRTPRP